MWYIAGPESWRNPAVPSIYPLIAWIMEKLLRVLDGRPGHQDGVQKAWGGAYYF